MIEARVISLDLDDTLWPVAPVLACAENALLAWLQRHHPHAMRGHDLASLRDLRAAVAERFPGQRHDLTFVRRRALAEQFAAAGYPAASVGESPVEAALEVFLTARNRIELYPDVRPALTRLRARYRLFAVSNGNADIERCGVADLFEGAVSAASAGAAKPDARIFASLVRMAGVAPREVIHVGDDPWTDVVGAMRAGMQAVWLNRESRAWPAEFAPPPRTVSTLADLA